MKFLVLLAILISEDWQYSVAVGLVVVVGITIVHVPHVGRRILSRRPPVATLDLTNLFLTVPTVVGVQWRSLINYI